MLSFFNACVSVLVCVSACNVKITGNVFCMFCYIWMFLLSLFVMIILVLCLCPSHVQKRIKKTKFPWHNVERKLLNIILSIQIFIT